MNNYEYIIASLPVLTTDAQTRRKLDFDAMVKEIKGHCSNSDKALIESLLNGFCEDSLDEAFYRKALASRNAFIRGYFTADLKMRDAKVRYLNRQLGRPENQDIFLEADCTPEENRRLESIFAVSDILGRERAMDDFLWESIDSMLLFHVFDMDVILGFIAKLHIICRWDRLDEEKGRELFRRLVGEVKGTFKGVEYSE